MLDFNTLDTSQSPIELAALDLGSNSFHMIIARYWQGDLQIIGKLQEKVQLAEGLDKTGQIHPAAAERGLDCLSRFAQRLQTIPQGHLRVVGTNTLRRAKNAYDWIEQAEALLKHPIEIISGREEARLIYLGVAHTTAYEGGKRLVIDIGGGSSEFIIGEKFEPLATESLHMGCVGYQKFFPNGTIKHSQIDKAILAARHEVQSIAQPFQKLGWTSCTGSSGTIRSIQHIMLQNEWSESGITLEGLNQLYQHIQQFQHIDELEIKGLKTDRSSIFIPGFCILLGIFQQLNLRHMTYSEGALREGLLYDHIGGQSHEDVRDRTIRLISNRFAIDVAQAERVRNTALHLFSPLDNGPRQAQIKARDLLRHAAELHEIGQVISHSQFHKHGAYLLQFADLQGFSNLEKTLIASLVRNHRRSLSAKAFQHLPKTWRNECWLLCLILRLAVLLNHARVDNPVLQPDISVESNKITLSFSKTSLQLQPLILAGLQQEQVYLQEIDWKLVFNEQMNSSVKHMVQAE
jgi:exopolyphosphatase/guanosine-5'-triphosphate,3'-diphosphate pyrophosphatase